jgi:probable F420-dependent oxidoreductase
MATLRTRLGIQAENMGRPIADPGLIAMARAIEASGADSVSVSDHLLAVAPEAGAAQGGLPETWLEALTCLAAIASVTTRVRLVASVIILPQRNVLHLLKTAATIDYLSAGRLVLGVGAGWHAPEMEALCYAFASRGQRMDEQLRVIRSAREAKVPAFQGAQVTVPAGVVLAPPSFPGHPIPVYIGGSGVSAVSLRRATEYGDGWMPYAQVGQVDHAALRRALGQLRDARARRGQAPLDTIFKLSIAGHADPALEREVAALAALGFAEVIVEGLWDAGLDKGIDAIQRVQRALEA